MGVWNLEVSFARKLVFTQNHPGFRSRPFAFHNPSLSSRARPVSCPSSRLAPIPPVPVLYAAPVLVLLPCNARPLSPNAAFAARSSSRLAPRCTQRSRPVALLSGDAFLPHEHLHPKHSQIL